MIVPAALLAGLGLLSLTGLRPRTGTGLLGGALFVGALGLALWTHLLLLVRVPVGLWSVLAGVPLMGAGLLRRGVFAVEWPKPAISSLPVLLAGAFTVAGALSWPWLGHDGEIFYLLRAKSILHYGTFWNPDFTDPARIHLGARRPLLLPSIYADFALLTGTLDRRLLRLWFGLVHLGGLVLLYDRTRLSPWWLAVLAWLPASWHDSGGIFTGYADPLVGLLFAFALVLPQKPPSILLISAAVLLKQDAWPFLIAVAAATAVTRPRELGRTAATLAVPAGLAIAWALVATKLAPQPDLGPPGQMTVATMASSLAWWPEILGRLGSELVKPKHWGAFWVVAMAALVVRARRLTRDDARWLLVILLQFLAYVAALATYRDQYILATRTQGMRLLFQLAPLMWVWVGSDPAAVKEKPLEQQ